MKSSYFRLLLSSVIFCCRCARASLKKRLHLQKLFESVGHYFQRICDSRQNEKIKWQKKDMEKRMEVAKALIVVVGGEIEPQNADIQKNEKK